MAVKNISQIQELLFGFSFLEGEEQNTVREIWNKRFSPDSAFLLENKPGKDIADIVEEIPGAMQKVGISSLNGRNVMIALFLDLTIPEQEAWLEKLWKISNVMSKYLRCSVSLVLQFGYVGELHLRPAIKQRAYAEKLVALNSQKSAAIQHRLVLISKLAFSANAKDNWKAPLILLDLLRRQVNPTDMLPNTSNSFQNNGIAFLRYEEYDEEKRSRLETELSVLRRALSEEGSQEFRQVLDREYTAFSRITEKMLKIDCGAQPLDPGLILYGQKASLFCNPQKKAENGTNQEFNQAVARTALAVQQTANLIKSRVSELCSKRIQFAPKRLKSLMEEARIGIKLKASRAEMEMLLQGNGFSQPNTSSLTLKYETLDAINHRIYDFLRENLKIAVDQELMSYKRALLDAYFAITDNQLEQERARLQKDYDAKVLQFSKTVTDKSFCNNILHFRHQPDACEFTVNTGNAKSQCYLLCRNDKDADMIKEAIGNGEVHTLCYQIQTNGGGIQELDTAPIKAVQIDVIDSEDEVLKQLLPDAEV